MSSRQGTEIDNSRENAEWFRRKERRASYTLHEADNSPESPTNSSHV